MATQTLPYESREATNEQKGKSKASSFELLDRLDGFPVLGTVYRTSTYVYGVTKNYNGLTRIGFEVFEAPVKVVATHVDDNFGPTLHRADQYACAQLDKAGEAVKQRLPNLEKLSADLRRGPEGVLQLGERVVDQTLPSLKGKKISERPASSPPRSNLLRAARLGATVADRLIERFVLFVQTLFSLMLLCAGSLPKRLKNKVQANAKSARNLIEFTIIQVYALIPFLNPFYTFRVIKYYVILFVIPSDSSFKTKKRAEGEQEEEEESAEEEETQETVSEDTVPKVEVSKKRRRRRNND